MSVSISHWKILLHAMHDHCIISDKYTCRKETKENLSKWNDGQTNFHWIRKKKHFMRASQSYVMLKSFWERWCSDTIVQNISKQEAL